VAHKFRWGDARPSMVLRKTAVVVVVCALLLAAGCGEEGVGDDAVVTVYASAPLCAGAKQELARSDGRAGKIGVRVVCLGATEDGDKLDLATIGANARRATEDSTTVGYLEASGPATRFSVPILEEAGIAQILSNSGSTAMAKLLEAIRDAGSSGSLRESVLDDFQ